MFVRNFKSFQSKKRSSENVSESVEVRDDKFIVGGIVVTQTMINKYKARLKEKTGENPNLTISDKDLAETLTSYLVSKASDDIDSIPLSAVLGGEDEMTTQVGDVSVEEEDVTMGEDGIEPEMDEFNKEGEVGEDVFDEVSDDEFESPLPEDDTLPEGDVEGLEELDGELTDEMDQLDLEEESEGSLEDSVKDDDDDERLSFDEDDKEDDEDEDEDLPL